MTASAEPPRLSAICVYCGSSRRGDPTHSDLARDLGGLIARAGAKLVFGGGHVGLMGACADGALAAGGAVAGVIPEHLRDRELAHPGVADMTVTDGMHTRKALMVDLVDAFCVLPGGFGTLDELFETLTWRQLGLHAKPMALVNAGGYWDPLIALFDAIIDGGYAAPAARDGFVVVDRVEEVIPALCAAL